MATDRGEFTFVVKEGSEDQASIVAEPTSDMPNAPGLIGFDLVPGTTFEQAQDIASFMRQFIRGISVTR
jgi:hypothetical protein